MWSNVVWAIFLGLLGSFSRPAGSRKEIWLDYLLKYINNEAHVHQVMLLTDGADKSVTCMENMIQEISRICPVTVLNIQDATSEKVKEMKLIPAFQDPGTTTLHVVIKNLTNDEDLAQMYAPINLLIQLSHGKSRPRCLFINLQKRERQMYGKFLQLMWAHQFLDAAVLEIRGCNFKKTSFFLNQNQELARVYRFNPFTNHTTRKKPSSKNIWFPNKLRDLHGYKIKAGFFDFPPYNFVIRNETNHITDTRGREVQRVKDLSKALNFETIKVVTDDTDWGEIPKTPNDTGLLAQVIRKEINFIAIESLRVLGCYENNVLWSRCSSDTNLSILVPIIQPITSTWFETSKVLNIFAVFSLVFFIWMITRFFHFKVVNWQLEDIERMLLGFTVPHEPQISTERLIFLFAFLTGFFFSSFIHSAFTDIGLQRTPLELKLNTIDDLLSIPDIHPTISSDWYNLFLESDYESIKRYMEKVKVVNTSNEECVKLLIKNKNITCVMRGVVAEIMIRRNLDKCGQSVMKILDEAFWPNNLCGLIMEPSSSFVKGFDNVLQRLIQGGLSEKWGSFRFEESFAYAKLGIHESCISRNSESQKLVKNIHYILLVGYSCAIVSFLLEMLLSLMKKKFLR